MTGGLIGAVGMMTSAWTQTGTQFVICIVIAGIGLSLVIVPVQVASTLDNFPKTYERAISFQLTGGGIGIMLLPPLSKQLHALYGWRGAVLILGALHLHNVVEGALIRPIERKVRSTANSAGTHGRRDDAVARPEKPLEIRPSERNNAASGSDESHGVHFEDEVSTARSVSACSNDTHNRCESFKSHTDDQDHIDSKKIVCCNGVKAGPSRPNCARVVKGADDILIHQQLPQRLHSNDEQVSTPSKKLCKVNQYVFRIARMVRNMFDLSLFIEHPSFLINLFVYFIFGMTYAFWVLFMIPNAIAKGFPPVQSAFLATSGGAANVAGRLAIGLISERNFVREEVLCSCICLIASLAFFCNMFASTFWSLVLLSVFNGLAVGARIVGGSLLAKKTLPIGIVSTGVFYTFVCIGLGEPVGGAIIGHLYDKTHSYSMAFQVAAAAELMIALVILIPAYRRGCGTRLCCRSADDVTLQVSTRSSEKAEADKEIC